MGRPPRKHDEKEASTVMLLAGLGHTMDEIAGVLGMADKTLKKLYDDELKHGRAKVFAKVGARIARRAMSDEPNADAISMFFAKTRMGWRENGGEAGQTIIIERSYGAKRQQQPDDPDPNPQSGVPSGAAPDAHGGEAV